MTVVGDGVGKTDTVGCSVDVVGMNDIDGGAEGTGVSSTVGALEGIMLGCDVGSALGIGVVGANVSSDRSTMHIA